MKCSTPLEMSEERLHWSKYFYYCPLSPSGLRWKIDNVGKNKIAYAKENDPAGFITAKGYWRLRFNNKAYLVHRIICELNSMPVAGLTVDHIDRNSLNNNLDNLRIVDHSVNCRNKGVPKNNTSGAVGVTWQINNGKKYAVAFWVDPSKKQPRRNKRFSISKYGEETAFKLACEYRLNKLREINAEYSLTHGINLENT